MVNLSKRQKDILLLLSRKNEVFTSDWIAKKLGVSNRTVRNEIKVLRQLSKEYGFFIESIRGQGYKLKLLNHDLFSEKIERFKNNNNEISGEFSDQNNRVFYMLRRLLLEKGYIKLEDFIDEMFVSLSTIQNDLKIVRKILKKYNLKLTSRPHYGTKIIGEEYMKRLCLSNIMFSQTKEEVIYRETFQSSNRELFEKIKEILIKKVIQYKIDMSDIALANLATHITIACNRIKKGFLIENKIDLLTEEYQFERMVAKEIIQEVEKISGLTFPSAEVDYIIIHLLGTKIMHKQELQSYSEYDEVNKIVNCMINRLKTKLNWDFTNDGELKKALTLHIRPAINRLKYKMNIRNPMLNDIKNKYPTAFEGAVVASKCIEEHLNMEVNEHEIGYIALHIGVALERMKAEKRKVKRVLIVCASGLGSAKLLYYRLRNLFERELEIVDTINYYNLSSYDLSGIDLILSTIPIKRNLNVPVKVVNTFLEEKDIQSIQAFIDYNLNEINEYIDASRIFLQKEFQDKESVIKFLCSELYNQQLVPKEYVDLVLDREERAPTSFGNLVAVPHPMTPVTNNTFWAICTLKRPIQWHDKQRVQVVFLLNIKKDAQGELEGMFKKLIHIIESKAIIENVINAKSPKEVLEILKLHSEN